MDFLELLKAIKMKTNPLLRTTLLACLLVTCFATSNGQKLTRDDWTELYGSTTAMEDSDNGRQANTVPNAPLTGDMSLRTNACPAAFIMNTPYNSNNGQRGCMFDITATNAVTIRCFESNVYSGTTANYEIYYRAGTHVGSENNAAAWTFLGGATGITSAGNNVPTALPIPINITIPAGQTYAFYITNDFGGGTSYTDGTAVGNFLAADANITVFEGVGKSYPFGLTFTVRNFNGHIFYDLAGVLDANGISLDASLSNEGPKIEWLLSEDMTFESLSLERSADGLTFSQLTDLPHSLDGTYTDRAPGASSSYFYRIRMVKADGNIEHSEAVEVKMDNALSFDLLNTYPNPFQDQLHLQLDNRLGKDIHVQVFDQMGRVAFEKEFAGVRGMQELAPDLSHLMGGIYTLRIRSGLTIQTMPVIRL